MARGMLLSGTEQLEGAVWASDRAGRYLCLVAGPDPLRQDHDDLQCLGRRFA